MRRLAFILALLPLVTVHAQPFNWQWSQHVTSSLSSPSVEGFATDALGNSYATGAYFGTVAFGALPAITSTGSNDVYVVKYDNQGVPLWVASSGGVGDDSPWHLAIDGSGGVAITGYFQSATATFGTTVLTKVGTMDAFVAKLNAADGSWSWAQRFGSNDFQSGQLEWAKAITCDDAGNIYVGGCFKYTLDVTGLPQLQGCSQYYNGFLLKLDPNGNGLWSRRPDCGKQWSYSASEVQALTIGDDGMLYAGFRARGDTLFFEGDTLLNIQASGQTHDVVIVKYDLNGAPLWTKVIGGYGYDDAQVLQADADGNLYAAIHREGDYGHLGVPNIAVSGNFGTYKNVILKMDADGAFIWGTRLGNSTYDHDIEAMALEAPDKLLVGGWHQGNFTIGGITPNAGISGSYGFYLARFDSSSALLNVQAQRHSYPRGIRGLGLDDGGNIYVGGNFQDSLALPGIPAMQLPSASDNAMFIARSGSFPTDLVTTEEANEVSAFPVPASGGFTLTGTAPFDALRIMDALGRMVHTDAFPPVTQRHIELNTAGVLVCELFHKGQRVGLCRVVLR
ncbi:MAG: hypothetical protein IT229_00755 [Flavobacteriales bacterium]|nr:hypothetical protein [Flavobacteriales bacterium]